MWMESLLFHTLPAPVGDFLEHHAKPVIGVLLELRLAGACRCGHHYGDWCPVHSK